MLAPESSYKVYFKLPKSAISFGSISLFLQGVKNLLFIKVPTLVVI